MKYFQILIALSNIHDPVDGCEITGLDPIETLIGNLLSNSKSSGQKCDFVCFPCADFIPDLEALDNHLTSPGHLQALEGKSFQAA